MRKFLNSWKSSVMMTVVWLVFGSLELRHGTANLGVYMGAVCGWFALSVEEYKNQMAN